MRSKAEGGDTTEFACMAALHPYVLPKGHSSLP